MSNFIIKKATVIDGTGNNSYVSDVEVGNGIITRIGKNLYEDYVKKSLLSNFLNEKKIEIYEADGLILCPGFIDIHSHSDMTIFEKNYTESRVLQGVTTDIGGNCGLSVAPANIKYWDKFREDMFFPTDDMSMEWQSVGEFLQYASRNGISVNFGTFVGHGTLRIAVAGYENRKLNENEIGEMKALTEEAMRDGAFGLTSGLVYSPGCFADDNEIIEIAKIAGKHGGIYCSHMRDEWDDVLKSIREVINIGKKADLPVHISHHKIVLSKHWGTLCKATVELIKRTKQSGIDITFDQYPYTSGGTTLSRLFPRWALGGGIDKLIERLEDSETLVEIKKEIYAQIDSGDLTWDTFTLGEVNETEYCGKTLRELGELMGKDPLEATIDFFIKEGNVSVFVDTCGEEDVRYIMENSECMFGSDGSAYSLEDKGTIHPRSFGTFPRIISKYCRELKIIELEDAIRRMTSMTANRLGLFDRGLIRPGMKADLVIFNFNEIEDTPNNTKPAQACKGIKKVFVNGVLTVDNGHHTGALAGQILKRGQTNN